MKIEWSRMDSYIHIENEKKKHSTFFSNCERFNREESSGEGERGARMNGVQSLIKTRFFFWRSKIYVKDLIWFSPSSHYVYWNFAKARARKEFFFSRSLKLFFLRFYLIWTSYRLVVDLKSIVTIIIYHS